MVKIVWNRENGQVSPKALPACNATRPAVATRQRCGRVRSIAGRHCGGQAIIEYAIATGVLIALVIIMGLFLTTFGDYGERLLAIIASDYP